MTAFGRAWASVVLSACFFSRGMVANEQATPSQVKPYHYIVRTGDSPSRLAQRWGLPKSLIAKPDHILKAGEALTIPLLARERVQRGGSLSVLSQKYGVSIETLAKFNRIRAPYHVKIGQIIMVPALK